MAAHGQSITVTTQVVRVPTTASAFAFFSALSGEYGSENVALLDAHVHEDTVYNQAMIGLFPILTLTVKDSRLNVTGDESLLQKLAIGSEQVINESLDVVLERVLQQFQADKSLPPFSFGWMGYFGFEAMQYMEKIDFPAKDDRNLPDVILQMHRVMIQVSPDYTSIFFHKIGDVRPPFTLEEFWRVVQAAAQRTPEPGKHSNGQVEFVEDVKKAEFIERVNKIKEHIRAGDIFQCVPSKRVQVRGLQNPLAAYARLRKINPSPYMFYVDYGSFVLFGASPEMQLRLVNGVALMKPIAGTSKGKGKTKAENEALVRQLAEDEKERAEHVMLVDLCRNDLGRLAIPGTVKVEKLLQVEEYSHVFHLVSHVSAQIPEGTNPFAAVFATFPAGTLSGAPKIRAIQILAETEPFLRGPYGGVVGMFDHQGNLDSAILIRTILFKDGIAYLQAGAGIVADSVPELEWEECDHKLGALRAIFQED